MNAQASSAIDKKAIIDDLMTKFAEIYIYPDIAERIREHLEDKLRKGEYDSCTGLAEFASELTTDMREISKDGHLVVYKMSSDNVMRAEGEEHTPDYIASRAHSNFGFYEVRRLKGNIGYLRFDRFDYPVFAGPTATAAMNFIANCDAVIIDLRNNHGGQEDMVQYLLSYFFKEPTHLLNLYNNKNEIIEQSWTHSYVPGKRMFDSDLYVLISNRTGSGAEAFSFDIKSYKRGTLIGQTTRGVAHMIHVHDLPGHGLRAHISNKRPANPRSGSCWEGVGVVPDIEVPDSQALEAAHLEALGRLLRKCADNGRRNDLEWDMVSVEAEHKPINLSEQDMTEYTGKYDRDRFAIVIRDGRLCRSHGDQSLDILIPLNRDLFGFIDTEDLRLRFERDNKNRITGFVVTDRSGDDGPFRSRSGDL